MNFLRIYILTLVICTAGPSANCQTAIIDSLRKKVYVATNNEEKLTAFLSLFEEFQSVNRDSLDMYGPQVKELAEKSNNQRNKSLATLAYANWYFRWGWSDSAALFIEPEFDKNPVTGNTTRDIYFKLSRAKAMYYGSKARFEQALEILYKVLVQAEKYKDTLNAGLSSNTIGSIAIARQEYKEALQWTDRALMATNKSNRFIQVLAPAYLNKGYAFTMIGNIDSAIYYISKGLTLSRQIQNLNYIATGLRLQARVYTSTKQYSEAEKALLEMISVRKKTSPVNELVDDNLQLAEFYAGSGQLKKAIDFITKNISIGDITKGNEQNDGVLVNDPRIRSEYLTLLSGYYKKAGMLSEYQAALEQLLITKDSLYSVNSAEGIAELQTKYDVQKKENTILQQKYGLQRKNFLLYAYIILSVALLLTGVFLFLKYRKKEKQRVVAMMEEEKRYAETAVKQAEEKERVRIASDLHDNLGAHAASMASNLSYIQLPDADETTRNALKELGNNSNAIISQLNDTIWVLNKEALHLTAISDRIKIFINRLQRSYPDIHIEVKEEIDIDYKLPSSHAFHLYRILQEAINNSLKHSKAKNIIVGILAKEGWVVTITDDGVGFDKVLMKHQSNGLQNMKQRSHEAGWNISWNETDGGGTVVKIEPTTN
jgi:signal transduction histidine kinase